jgi:hypothetical protein
MFGRMSKKDFLDACTKIARDQEKAIETMNDVDADLREIVDDIYDKNRKQAAANRQAKEAMYAAMQ